MTDPIRPLPPPSDEKTISLTWREGVILDMALGLVGFSHAKSRGFTEAEFDGELEAIRLKVWRVLDVMVAEHRAAKAAAENPPGATP